MPYKDAEDRKLAEQFYQEWLEEYLELYGEYPPVEEPMTKEEEEEAPF